MKIKEEHKIVKGAETVFADPAGTSFEQVSDLDERKGLTIQFLGTNSIFISDGETNLLIDPFFSRPSYNMAIRFVPFVGHIYSTLESSMEPDFKRITDVLNNAAIDKVDAICVTHSHFDHVMDVPQVWHYLKMNETPDKKAPIIVGSQSVFNVAKRGSVLPENLVAAKGDCFSLNSSRIGLFKITFIKGKHIFIPLISDKLSGTIPDGQEPIEHKLISYKEGEATYQIHIEHPWGSILNLGSANYIEGAIKEKIGHVDMLLIAVAGMNDLTATGDDNRVWGNTKRRNFYREVIEATSPYRIYLTHWDDFDGDSLFEKAEWFQRTARVKDWLFPRFCSESSNVYKTIAFLPRWDKIKCYLSLDKEAEKKIPAVDPEKEQEYQPETIDLSWKLVQDKKGIFESPSAVHSAEDHSTLFLKHLGTNTVLISHGDISLLIDPFFSRTSLKELYTVSEEVPADADEVKRVINKAGIKSIDAIICTHSCFQYVMDLVEIWNYFAVRPWSKIPFIIAPKSVTVAMKKKGVNELFLIPSFDGDEPFTGIKNTTGRFGKFQFFYAREKAIFCKDVAYQLLVVHPAGKLLFKRLAYLPEKSTMHAVDILIMNLAGSDSIWSFFTTTNIDPEKEGFYSEHLLYTLPHRIYFTFWDKYRGKKMTTEAEWGMDPVPAELSLETLRFYKKYHPTAVCKLMPRWEAIACSIDLDRKRYAKSQEYFLKSKLFVNLDIEM